MVEVPGKAHLPSPAQDGLPWCDSSVRRLLPRALFTGRLLLLLWVVEHVVGCAADLSGMRVQALQHQHTFSGTAEQTLDF